MSLRAPPPAESDLLCEQCGYILNGLAGREGNCPECGTPTRASLDPEQRVPSPIEIEWSSRRFWQTTWQVLLRKRAFFQKTLTRAAHPNVGRFGKRHRAISGILFGLAGGFHAWWMDQNMLLLTSQPPGVRAVTLIVLTGALVLASIVILSQVTRLATWLTTKEGAFWGMRLPIPVVTRAMAFHAANYLPISIAAVLVTAGYRAALALGWLDAASGVIYLITLSVLVVASALWLFESYVIAMRRIRRANF